MKDKPWYIFFKRLRILDVYIVRKFLGTFFFSLVLILGIAVIFDVSEKLDDFMQNQAPLKAIVFEYYFNFIPYFAVLFSYLFVFISVIFFTSKMAYDTEIIAIISSGVSLNRLLVPYMFSALCIASLSFYLSNYVIPQSTEKRLIFEEHYYRDHPVYFSETNVHKQIEPGVYIYMESFSTITDIGRRFSMEHFEDNKLTFKLISDFIRWDSTKNKWEIRNYYMRTIDGDTETLTEGIKMDTTLNLHPSDFKRRAEAIETFSTPRLTEFIEEQKLQGAENIEVLLLEKYRRFATPFATFILTIIGVSVSSRKVRGGIGMHIGLGILISFSYILFMQFSSQFAIGGSIPPLLAVWLPNIIYAVIAIVLYVKTPK